MFSLVISTIYILNNFYFPLILGINTDIFINALLIVTILLVKITAKLSFDRKYFLLTTIIGVFIAINGVLNFNIYYSFQLIRNALFVIVTALMFKNFDFRVLIKRIYLGLWLNNIIIIFQVLNIDYINKIIANLQSIFVFSTRIDYRTSGVVGGPLKAGVITTFLLIYTIYFLDRKKTKTILCIVLLAFSLIQARTALLLNIIILIIYFAQNFRTNYSINFKKTARIFTTILISFVTLFILAGTLKAQFPYIENTIKWQANELLNISDSKTIEILTSDSLAEAIRFTETQNFIYTLLGNGKTNWDGSDSIHTDNGFVTLFIGLGSIGLTLLLIFYFIIYLDLLVNTRKSKKMVMMTHTLFIVMILLNFKSTSFTGYHYFNLIVVTYFMINYYASKHLRGSIQKSLVLDVN